MSEREKSIIETKEIEFKEEFPKSEIDSHINILLKYKKNGNIFCEPFVKGGKGPLEYKTLFKGNKCIFDILKQSTGK